MVQSTGPGGSCEWKRDDEGNLPSECPAADDCAAIYQKRFKDKTTPEVGLPEAWQSDPLHDHDAVERSSASDYILVITDGKTGPGQICASFPNLPDWRCQKFFMGADGDSGLTPGVDQDGSRSVNVPK